MSANQTTQMATDVATSSFPWSLPSWNTGGNARIWSLRWPYGGPASSGEASAALAAIGQEGQPTAAGNPPPTIGALTIKCAAGSKYCVPAAPAAEPNANVIMNTAKAAE